MDAVEQKALIRYANLYGNMIGNRYPHIREDVRSASLHGAAIAFTHPNFPGDKDGRRKFLGTCCWNMMRRELAFQNRRRPIAFTDLEEPVDAAALPSRDLDWADLSGSFAGRTADVFSLLFGLETYTQPEVASRLGISITTVRYHLQKIKHFVREREASCV